MNIFDAKAVFNLCRNFNPDDKKSIAESVYYKNFHTIFWEIISYCNYNCFYCFNENTKEKQNKTDKQTSEQISSLYHPKITNEELVNIFNKTKKTWVINFSGGEPFLYQGFISLLSDLSEKHYFYINTNMSSDKIYELPHIKKPSNIVHILASYHILERERRGISVEDFIKKVLFLQENGIPVSVTYVAHPILLSRIQSDLDYLRKRGVINFMPQRFIGEYNGKIYPEAYSDMELKQLHALKDCYDIDIDPISFNYNTIGRKCLAGKKFFVMNEFGKLVRCSTINKNHGNLFEEKVKYSLFTKKCTAICRTCPIQGILFSKK